MDASTDLTVGGLMRRAYALLRAHPLPLLLPPILLSLVTGGGNQGGPRNDMSWPMDPGAFDPLTAIPFYALVATIVTAVIVALIVATLIVAFIVIASSLVLTATTRALLDHLDTGAAPDFGAAFRAVNGRWKSLGWTYFLACLFVLLGFIALIVPGVIALAGLLPLFAVLATETALGGRDALRRTWAITKGRKGTLAGIVLLGILANILVGAIFGWIPFLGWIASAIVGGSVMAAWLVIGVTVYRAQSPPAAVPPAVAPMQ